MSFLRTALISLFSLIILIPATHAATINDEGAQRLKALFEEMIQTQTSITQRDGVPHFYYDGKILVEQAASYYAITLPPSYIDYPDGSRLDLGMLAINALPNKNPGQWKMTIAIPTPILMLDKTGAENFRINIGGQRSTGIWDESLKNFARLDANYNDITLTDAKEIFSLKIPKAGIRYNFKQDKEGHWSGPGYMSLKNATLEIEKITATLGELRADFKMDRYNPLIVDKYKDDITALSETITKNAQNKTPEPLSSDATSGLVNMMIDLVTQSSNGFSFKYSASDFHFSQPLLTATQDETSSTFDVSIQDVKLGKAFLGFDISGFFTDKVSLGLNFGFSGLSMTPEDPEITPVAPSQINIDIALENIPFKQIAELGKNSLQAGMAQPEMAQMAGIGMLMKLPALLSQAGTQLTIENNALGNTTYNIDLNGKAQADMMAVNSVTAHAKMNFRGLDEIIAHTQNGGAQNGAEQSKSESDVRAHTQNLQKLSMMLGMLKGMGKLEENTSGPSLYSYEFIMTPQGQMLLNGQDINPLSGGAPTPTPEPVSIEPTP